MPADVSFQSVRPVTQAQGHRLPIGVGLMIAAALSVGLWIAAAAGLRALLF